MGFSDQLARYTTNLNRRDPVFGGLIPRREMIVPEAQQPMQQPIQQMPIPPRGAINSLPQQNNMPGKVVFDWSRQENDRRDKALEFDKERFASSQKFNEQAGAIQAAENADKSGLAHQKQALDEWKAKNPEGQVQVVNGRVYVIDKITGKPTDTGLAGDHLDEKEKIRLGIEGRKEVANVQAQNAWSLSGTNAQQAKELEGLRQKNRTELANADRTEKQRIEAAKSGTAVSPSQQRVAEDDAAAELLRDPKFAWLERDKHITFDPKTGIKIDRSKASDTTYIDEFEKAWKAKAKERMNVTRDKTSLGIGPDKSNTPPKIGDVKTYPNGNKAQFDGTGWEMIPKE